MINQDTLFILGAGASKPYGYPTGKELRKFICRESFIYLNNILNKDPKIDRREKNEINREAKKFAKIFEDSSILSIDQFLALNPIFSYTGKLAIATSILHFEKTSRFHEDIKDSYQDWYTFLYKRMTEGFASPDSYNRFKENKVSFITFNYDRSLEHFIYTSLVNSFYQEKIGN